VGIYPAALRTMCNQTFYFSVALSFGVQLSVKPSIYTPTAFEDIVMARASNGLAAALETVDLWSPTRPSWPEKVVSTGRRRWRNDPTPKIDVTDWIWMETRSHQPVARPIPKLLRRCPSFSLQGFNVPPNLGGAPN